MITIKAVKIKDFGPLADFSYTFPRTAGTFAVRAPNGAGKSHFVDALRATSTSLIAPEKPRGALIRNYGLNGETARIEVVYDVDGEELAVVRSIAVKGSLSAADVADLLARGGYPDVTTRHQARFRDHKYAKAVEIDELIASVFGIVNPVQAQAVFVPQGQSGALWRGTQATRAAAFQFLSGADRLVEVNRYVEKRMTQFKATDYSEDLAVAEADHARLEREAAAVAEKLAAEPVVDLKELDGLHAELRALREARERERNNARIDGEIAEHVRKANELAAAIVAMQEERRALGLSADNLNDLRERAAAARELVRRADAVAAEREKINSLSERISSLHNRLSSVVLDDPELVEKHVVELREAAHAVSGPLTEVLNSINKFGTSGKCPTCGSSGICPKCGHAETNLPQLAVEWRQNSELYQRQLNDINQRLTAMQQRHAAAVKARQAYDGDQRRLAEWIAARDAAEAALAPPAAGDVAEAKRLLATDHPKFERFTMLLRDEEQLRREVDWLGATVEALRRERREVGESDRSPEREQALQERINGFTAAAARRGELEGNVKGLATQLESARARVTSIRERIGQQEKVVRVAEFLGGIRAATHPNAIPKDRAAAYIARINRRLAFYCQELKLPFSLEVDPEQQDLMYGDGELVAPAQHRLSEGQRTMAGWVWHLALYALHGGRVGYLVMDEPTVGLDAENRRCVAAAVRNLSGFCNDTGMQMILVTHDADIGSAFDTVIELGAA